MKNIKKTIFISDLHLSENQPKITQNFLTLLSTHRAEAIYILGDFFETWIGDDDPSDFHSFIKRELKKITIHTPIYFMHGNRDFLVGKRFFTETGCIPLTDEHKILLYGIPVLLMHGDTLCTLDKNYLKMRQLFRNKLIQRLFLLLPLRYRQNIAMKMRAKSMNHLYDLPKAWMDVVQSDVMRVMEKHQVQFLIHGHTHQPKIENFILNNSSATRLVLSAWHDQGQALIWDENAHYEMVII